MTRVTPYLKKYPKDLILSDDWNEIQTCAREEIQSHTHQGGEDGTLIPREGIQPNAIDGTRIDPASEVTVAQLKVNNRELLKDIDSLISRADAFGTRLGSAEARLKTLEPMVDSAVARLSTLETGKVNRSGDTIQGNLEVIGLIHGTVTRPLREQLVHRRLLYGDAGDSPLPFSQAWTMVRSSIAYPFEAPSLQAKARRLCRLQAVFWSQLSAFCDMVVRIESLNTPSISAVFSWPANELASADFPMEWPSRFHALSGWVELGPSIAAMPLWKLMIAERAQIIRDSPSEVSPPSEPSRAIGSTLFHLELQMWDFF